MRCSHPWCSFKALDVAGGQPTAPQMPDIRLPSVPYVTTFDERGRFRLG